MSETLYSKCPDCKQPYYPRPHSCIASLLTALAESEKREAIALKGWNDEKGRTANQSIRVAQLEEALRKIVEVEQLRSGAACTESEVIAGDVLTSSPFGIAERRECLWTENEDCFETGCEESFILIDGTPEDNGMKFCPYCGKTLRADRPEEPRNLCPVCGHDMDRLRYCTECRTAKGLRHFDKVRNDYLREKEG